jgi:hypothetical protein
MQNELVFYSDNLVSSFYNDTITLIDLQNDYQYINFSIKLYSDDYLNVIKHFNTDSIFHIRFDDTILASVKIDRMSVENCTYIIHFSSKYIFQDLEIANYIYNNTKKANQEFQKYYNFSLDKNALSLEDAKINKNINLIQFYNFEDKILYTCTPSAFNENKIYLTEFDTEVFNTIKSGIKYCVVTSN